MKLKITILAILFAISVSAQVNEVPSPRFGHSVVYNDQDNNYYVFGGTVLSSTKSTTSNFDACVYKYDPFAKTFTKVCPPAAPGVSGHKALYVNGKMVVFGGSRVTAGKFLPTYDPISQIWTNIEYQYGPDARKIKAGAAVIGNFIYYMGGKNFDNSVSNEVWKYDINNNTFTLMSSMPQSGRYAHQVVAHNGTLLVFGGRDENGEQSQMISFDPTSNSWDFFDPMGMPPMARANNLSGVLPNEMWIAGGETQSTKKSTSSTNFLTDIWKLDLSQTPARWVKKSEIFIPVTNGVGWISVQNNDTLFYAFGGISEITSTGDTTVTNNFYRYNITESIVEQYHEDTQNWGGIITSINEIDFNRNINLQIYPNPATSEISLTIPNNEIIVSIKIYNQNGQLVKQINKPDSQKITISDLKTGLYFIRTDTETNRYLSKMIKE